MRTEQSCVLRCETTRHAARRPMDGVMPRRATRVVLLLCAAAALALSSSACVADSADEAEQDVLDRSEAASTKRGSITLVLLDSTDGIAHHNQRVTFTVSTNATDQPTVGLRCYQGENFVYDAYVLAWPGAGGPQWFTLTNSLYWVDGVDASCTARLFYWDHQGQKVLTTLTFPVAP